MRKHHGAEYFVESSVCHPERSAAESKDLSHKIRFTRCEIRKNLNEREKSEICLPIFAIIEKVESEFVVDSGAPKLLERITTYFLESADNIGKRGNNDGFR